MRLATALLVVLGAAGMVNAQTVKPLRDFGIVANNAFFYYADLPRATRFYTETLGLPVVADYGYAKILRIADSSFLTLVDATKGMHTADEPKTTAIALVTDQLDAWYARVTAAKVPVRGPFNPVAGRPHHGFVAIDPEGYFLEFERFNPHEENRQLMPVLEKLAHRPTAVGGPDGAKLGFNATVLWTYYRDLAAAQKFYEQTLGFELIVDQGWTKIYQTSPSGFIGLVDQARGMHKATEKKGVTVSFLTNQLDRWFGFVKSTSAFPLRAPEINVDAEKRYRAFVGFDPEGYYLEFDDFLVHPTNQALLDAIRRR